MIKSASINTTPNGSQFVSIEVDNGKKVEHLSFTEEELMSAANFIENGGFAFSEDGEEMFGKMENLKVLKNLLDELN